MIQDSATITRDIYPMPAFLTLTVADLERSVAWYTQGLDFIELARMPQLVHLRRFRNQDILLFPAEPGSRVETGSGWTLSLQGGGALPALAERVGAYAPNSSSGMVRRPWNVDELRCTDPDGYTIVFTDRVPDDEMDEGFSAAVRASVVAAADAM
jgi:catechol 2,3-dioxygenase-like lactoylglutathione lyase family enzyme